MIIRRLAALAALIAVAFAPAAGLAAAKDRVFNKEGFWGIEADGGACAASMNVEGGAILLFRSDRGAVTFAVFSPKRLPRGKAGLLAADEEVFEVPLTYTEGAKSVFYDGELGASVLAALRAAKELRIAADKRLVLGVELAGTGFPGALDALVACSKGEAGWWGKGVDIAAVEAAAARVWAVERGEGGICSTMALDANGAGLVLLTKGTEGRVLASVGSAKMGRRGSKGVLRIDGEAWDFKPEYDGADYFSAGFLSPEAVAQLKTAKAVVISVDGREILDLRVAGTKMDEAFADLAACGRGQEGYWTGAANP